MLHKISIYVYIALCELKYSCVGCYVRAATGWFKRKFLREKE